MQLTKGDVMSHKFTADGKKVVVVGALNAKETIVQEIFVNDGTEFPAAEHFVVKTLLDAPAETYKAKEEKRVMESIKGLEAERDRLSTEIKGFRFKCQSAAAKVKWIDGIREPEVKKVVNHIKSVLCGEYTHIVFDDYRGPKIAEWDAELFSMHEGYGENRRFDGIRLVSLFGVWNGRLELDWCVHSYSDGSGSGRTSFTPCKSLQEAVEIAAAVINAKDHITDGDVEFCMEYGIPVDGVKDAARIARRRCEKEKEIVAQTLRLSQLEADLAAIG